MPAPLQPTECRDRRELLTRFREATYGLEFVNDLGRRTTVPCVTPTTQALADVATEAQEEAIMAQAASHHRFKMMEEG